MNKLLASSANPERLSLTVKGILIGLIPVIIYLAGKYGFQLTQVSAVEIINQIFLIVSEIVIVVGMCRKLYFFIMGKKNIDK